MEHFAMGHAFSLGDLFSNFNVRKLKMTPELCKEVYSDGSKRDFSASIFANSLRLIIDDIIDNNTEFKFPGMGRTLAYMRMKRTQGELFKKAFKRGKWRDVDFVTSDFSGYLICLDMRSEKRLPREKLIYLATKDKLRITEHTNNGKQY